MLAWGGKRENHTADWTQGYATHFMEASSKGSQEISMDGRTEQFTCRTRYLDYRQKTSIQPQVISKSPHLS